MTPLIFAVTVLVAAMVIVFLARELLRYRLEREHIKIARLKAERDELRAVRHREATEGGIGPSPSSREKAERPVVPFPDPPAGLVRAIQSGETILFAGNDMAALRGVPSLRELLVSIFDQIGEDFGDAPWAAARDAASTGEESISVDFLRAQLGNAAFETLLRDALRPFPCGGFNRSRNCPDFR